MPKRVDTYAALQGKGDLHIFDLWVNCPFKNKLICSLSKRINWEYPRFQRSSKCQLWPLYLPQWGDSIINISHSSEKIAHSTSSLNPLSHTHINLHRNWTAKEDYSDSRIFRGSRSLHMLQHKHNLFGFYSKTKKNTTVPEVNLPL